jgi:phosphatidylglycerol lysyltransferase
VFSVLAFAAGVILLLSSATPAVASRLHFLATVAPLIVLELSHFLASVTGALLLLVAAGLWRKQEGAYIAALLLLILGAVFSILKGVDVEEALMLTAVALLLAPCRGAFTRKSSLLSGALTPSWLASVTGAAAAAGWLGLFAYRHVEYSDQLWWTFLRDAEASRFLRAAAGVAIVVTLTSAWVLLAPPRPRWRGRPAKDDLEDAAAIISCADGMRGDAHLSMLADKDLLFSPSRKSFIMFRVVGRRWIAMSEPCGLASEKRALMWRFAELADEAGASPAFYAISDALLPDVAELGLAVRKIGETAVILLPDFSLDGKDRASLRHARNRAERQGATFTVLPPGSAGRLWRDLQDISDAWLQNRSAGEKGFSLGRFDRDYLNRTPLAIVRQRGRVVAFANVWTTADKREATADLMRYSEDAPKGVMDYLFVKLMEWARDRGYREFDLGMAPLAGLGTHRLAPSFSKLGAAVFDAGEALYGFRGLRAYKEKFDPEWRPLYLAAPPGELMAFALLDVARLTSGGWRNLLFANRKREISAAGAPQGAAEIAESQEDEDRRAGVRQFRDIPDEQRRARANER